MDRFRPISLNEREWIRECLEEEKSLCADFSFEGNYIWRDSANQHVAKICGMYVVRIFYEGRYMFSSPVGGGDRKAAIEEIRDICKKEGIRFVMCSATKAHLDECEKLGITGYKKIDMIGAYDYIYDAEKLATLSGKKLSKKRNHINRLEAEHEWKTEVLTSDNIDIALNIYKKWLGEKGDEEISKEHEKSAIKNAFADYDALGLDGMILYIDNEPKAFTVGSMINSEVADIHFEKADRNERGAYPLINREFVRYMKGKYKTLKYINREDDMGIEGLRKSKHSYHPLFLVDKHTLEFEV